MEILRLGLENYRGIEGIIELDVQNNPIIPIIGLNESGKTSILKGIYALDPLNDIDDESDHLTCENLAKFTPPIPYVYAIIEASKEEVCIYLLNSDDIDDGSHSIAIKAEYKRLKRYIKTPSVQFVLRRNLKYQELELGEADFSLNHPESLKKFLSSISVYLPFILYFDEFTQPIPNVVDIESDSDDWAQILETLSVKSGIGFDIKNIKQLDPSRRRVFLEQMSTYLNRRLTEEWEKWRISDDRLLNVNIEYIDSDSGALLTFKVREGFLNGNIAYYNLHQRSKGFCWFFNFVMRLEFNYKRGGMSPKTIFLLDEPSAYLHPKAQKDLIDKFVEISRDNIVI